MNPPITEAPPLAYQGNQKRGPSTSVVLRCLSLIVSSGMAIALLIWAPNQYILTGQVPVPERLATLESQMKDMAEVKAMAIKDDEKINTFIGVGTGAFSTLAILDILQLLATKRRGSKRDDG